MLGKTLRSLNIDKNFVLFRNAVRAMFKFLGPRTKSCVKNKEPRNRENWRGREARVGRVKLSPHDKDTKAVECESAIEERKNFFPVAYLALQFIPRLF